MFRDTDGNFATNTSLIAWYYETYPPQATSNTSELGGSHIANVQALAVIGSANFFSIAASRIHEGVSVAFAKLTQDRASNGTLCTLIKAQDAIGIRRQLTSTCLSNRGRAVGIGAGGTLEYATRRKRIFCTADASRN